MQLEVLRFSSQTDSTSGLLFEVTDIKRHFLCYTIEDERRALKVRGETRVPAGTYKVGFTINILKNILVYTAVCFISLTSLTLSIFLYIPEILMSTLLGVLSLATRKKITYCYQTASLVKVLTLIRGFILVLQKR